MYKALKIVKSNIDWDYFKENISKKNLGCKYRVSSGLDWVLNKPKNVNSRRRYTAKFIFFSFL